MCIIRSKIPYAVLISLCLPGPQRSICEFSYSSKCAYETFHLPQAGKVPHLASSLLARAAAFHLVLSLTGFDFAASPRFFSNKPVTSSRENQRSCHRTLVTPKPSPHRSCLSSPEYNSMVALNGMRCPSSPNCKYL